MTQFLDRFLKHLDPTPHWAKTIINNQEKIMAALDDLKSAIADLKTQLDTNNADIEALLAKIVAPGTSDADVEQAVADIRALIASNKAETDKLAP